MINSSVKVNLDNYHVRTLKDEHLLLDHKEASFKLLIFFYKKFSKDLLDKQFTVTGAISAERGKVKLLAEDVIEIQ